jgi:hypothetical protein
MTLRIATFNLENLDDDDTPNLENRIWIMKPQLERVNADILCLQEVHSQGTTDNRTLVALDQLMDETKYANFKRETTKTTDGKLYVERNIVTMIRPDFDFSDVEIIRDNSGPRPSYQMATAIPEDTTSQPVSWERPMLYTQINLGSGRILHVINLHLKSKIASNIPGQKIDNFTWRTVSAWAEGSFISSMKRVGQALQTRLLIDKIFDDHGLGSLIATCGDFNADLHEVPMKAIRGQVEETGNPDHGPRLMVPCESNIPESSRYSLWHLGQGQMLDHIIASRPLIQFFSHAEIHNEALPDESGAFRTDIKFPESDHAPVVAEFTLG